MFRSASDLYNQVVEAAQNQKLWERSRTKPGENRIKNEIRCSAPFRICIKRVVEAKQNQELWERSYTNQERIHANCSKVRIKCGVPLRFKFVLSELWKPNKTRSCGKEAIQTRRIHANCSCTNVRMKPDVPLRFGFVLSELWKPHKTRSCGKEAVQNQERIELRMKSDVPLRFGFV